MRSSYLRSVSAQALARILYVLSGTIVFVAVARILGPYELGRYALIVNLQNLAVTAADLGTTTLLSRDLVTSTDHRSYAGSFILFRLILGLLVGAVSAFLTLAFAPPDLEALLLVCAALVPLNALRFFDPIFQFQGHPFRSAGLAALYTLLLPTLSVAALALPSDRAAAVSVAFAVAGAIYGLAGILLVIRTTRPRLNRAVLVALPGLWRAALPLGTIGLLNMLTLRLDVLMVEWLGGSVMLGLYNAAFRLFDLGVAVIVTLVTPLVPVLARLAAQDRARLEAGFEATMRLSAAALGLCATIAPSLGPSVLQTLYGSAYAVAGSAAGLLAWKLMLGTLNLLLISYLMSVGSIRLIWLGSVAALASNLVLNLVLIPRLGLDGAADAALICEIPPLLVTLASVRRSRPRAKIAIWWSHLLLAIAAGLLTSAFDLPDILRGAAAAIAYGSVLFLFSAWPSNPLPLLQVDLQRS